MNNEITPLGFAIMGLLFERPRTGYAVRKVFEETALGQYSSSPGSIYPALKRLQTSGLVEKATEQQSSARPSSFYRLTRRGRNRFREWLRSPVTRRDVTHGMQEVMLRFAFMDHLPTAEAVRFLRSLELEIRSYLSELESFQKEGGSALPLVGRLAVENGLATYRAHAEWAKEAAHILERGKS